MPDRPLLSRFSLLFGALVVTGLWAVRDASAETGTSAVSDALPESYTVIRGSSTSQIACRDEAVVGTRVERRRCQTVTAWRAESDLTNILRNIDYAVARPRFNASTFQPSRNALPESLLSCPESWPSDNDARVVELASVALTQSNSSNSNDERFDNLVCRASAYQGQRNFGAAERDYREALRLAARRFDPFDPRLIPPLTRLGRIRLNANDVDDAELLLLRAQDITHRNAGIYNVQQKELVDDLSRVLVRQGRLMQANRQQELRLKSARETYGRSPELVTALHDYARWNAAIQRFPNVGDAFDEAVSILEDTYGPNDPRLIETLRLRAKLYALHPTISAPLAGKTAMERIVDIYESQESVDQVDVLNARTDVGDWHLRGLRKREALNYYRDTVQQALADGLDPTVVDSVYGTPKLFFIDSTAMRFLSPPKPDDTGEPGIVRVSYVINQKGFAKEPKIIEDTVGNAELRAEIIKRIRFAVFRPRFENGVATTTTNVEQIFKITRVGVNLTISAIYAPIIVHR